ncbi:MAG: hypothetical protein ABIP89_15110 [Polyangiaceae bacterium]
MIPRISLVLALILAACGGRVGNESDTSVTDSGTPGTSPGQTSCSSCSATSIGWGSNGGISGSTLSSSTISDCAKYRHEETRSSSQDSCTYAIPACGSSPISIGEIQEALKDADVLAARSASTKLYGSDPRGCDGAVFALTLDGKQIEIGDDDCSRKAACAPGTVSCVPVPAGLRALVMLLNEVDDQALATANCRSVFPAR